MSNKRPPLISGPAWQTTQASALPEPPGAGARAQPPLVEQLKGLDTRELEGQTVFDQLFGDDPAAPPAPRR